MTIGPPRILYSAHDSPGRLRLRASWLRDDPAEAPAIADRLSAIDGVIDVQVRAFTGSILVVYDPQRVPAELLRGAVCAATGIREVTRPGHETAEQVGAIIRDSVENGSELARQAARAFQGIDVDVRRLTGGHLSLGAIVALALWAGAAEKIISDKRLRLPEWHSLLWMGFRSLVLAEERAIHPLAPEEWAPVHDPAHAP